MDAVLSCMVTDSLGPGSLSLQLTDAVADYLGLAGGIALRERARAFSIAVDRLGLARGASVVLDPLVPHAYHAVLVERGLVPHYVDVDKGSLCIGSELVERTVQKANDAGRPVGAIVTHTTLGFVPDMEAIVALGVPVIEDVSEGIGANTGEDRVGRYGRLVIVAMEPESVITAGGGTLVLAASKADRSALRRVADELSSDALLPDMNAALGVTQIKEIEKFVARRSEIASAYSRAIMRGRHRSPVQPGEGQNVFLTFPVLIEGRVADVEAYARKKGVETRLAFEGTVLDRYGRAAHEEIAAAPEGEPGVEPRDDGPEDTNSGSAPAAEGGSNDGRNDVPSPEAPLHEVVVSESEFPVARSLLLRCVQFPLYPSLTAKEVSTIERVLTTLP